MRNLTLLACFLSCGPAQADDGWHPMSRPGITQALTGRKLQYAQAWQAFRSSGRTIDNAGRDSWGCRGVRGDRYCSMWPTSDVWTCYDMARPGPHLRFIGATGDSMDAA